MSETVGVERGFAPGELAWQHTVLCAECEHPLVRAGQGWGHGESWRDGHPVRPPFTERKL